MFFFFSPFSRFHFSFHTRPSYVRVCVVSFARVSPVKTRRTARGWRDGGIELVELEVVPRDIIRTVNSGLARGTGKLCLRRNWPKSRIQLRLVLSRRGLVRRPLTTDPRVTRFRVPPGREYNFDYCHPSKDRSSKASCTFPTHESLPLRGPLPPIHRDTETEKDSARVYVRCAIWSLCTRVRKKKRGRGRGEMKE